MARWSFIMPEARQSHTTQDRFYGAFIVLNMKNMPADFAQRYRIFWSVSKYGEINFRGQRPHHLRGYLSGLRTLNLNLRLGRAKQSRRHSQYIQSLMTSENRCCATQPDNLTKVPS
jgi:hypothetical protein